MHVVYEAADPMEAHLVRDFLRNAGVDAVCLDVAAWGGRGDLPANVFPRVAVRTARELPQAEALMREYRRGPGSDWRCRRCRELVTGSMALCWNCGAAAPGD